jgi:hypothetical protein
MLTALLVVLASNAPPHGFRSLPLFLVGQVGGGVAVAAVTFADDQRKRLSGPVGESLREHAQCAFAVPQQPELVELLDDRRQVVVVGTLSDEVGLGQARPEPLIDRHEVPFGFLHQQPPQPQGGRVATLEQDHASPCPLPELLRGVELGSGGLVEAVQIADGQLVGGFGLADIEEVFDEHPERGAPVAEVVLADHAVSKPLEQTHGRVSDDGGAEMADVHLLGRVGCGVVDFHGLGLGERHAQPVIGVHRRGQAAKRVIGDRQVDEARP